MKGTKINKTSLAVVVAFFLLVFIGVLRPINAVETKGDIVEEPSLYFTFEGKLYEFKVLYSDIESNNSNVVKVCKCNENVSVEFVSNLIDSKKMSTETIKSVRDYLLGRTKEITNSEDNNNDGIVNIFDLIIAKNMYISNPVNYLQENGKYMPINDFIELLKYYSNQNEFVVKYGDKVPVVTTYPNVTTTRVTTTTPKVITTVVTTTPQITTTVATTTSTVPIVTMAPEKKMINDVLAEMQEQEDKIPPCSEENDFQQNDVFYFKADKFVYAYTLGSKTQKDNPLMVDSNNISSMHIWKYEGIQKLFDVNLKLPDTTGKTFTHKGIQYEYELKPYDKINESAIITIAKYLSGVKKISLSSAAFDLLQYDYNLSGDFDKEDLKIMIKAYSSNPNKFLNFPDDELFYRYFDVMDRLEQTNVLLKKSENEIVDYSYVVPCMDYNSKYTGKTWICPLQVLPKQMVTTLEKEGHNEWSTTDMVRDWILWRPLIFGQVDGSQWSSASVQMEHWLLCNYYVLPLDEYGMSIKKWIK